MQLTVTKHTRNDKMDVCLCQPFQIYNWVCQQFCEDDDIVMEVASRSRNTLFCLVLIISCILWTQTSFTCPRLSISLNKLARCQTRKTNQLFHAKEIREKSQQQIDWTNGKGSVGYRSLLGVRRPPCPPIASTGRIVVDVKWIGN